MGWSCSAAASDTMNKMTQVCRDQTGQQNVFEVEGTYFFWETSRREYDDGSVTGRVYRMEGKLNEPGLAYPGPTFRIDGPTGKMTRGPAVLKRMSS